MGELTQEFDLHAAIRKLAEVEWPCPGCSMCNPRNIRAALYGHCMDGTGRIVPFASLRVECSHPNSVWRDTVGYTAFCPDCGAEWHPKPTNLAPPKGCWFPEPDVEKACWRLHELGYEGQTKEAVLRAAQVWAREQKGVANE